MNQYSNEIERIIKWFELTGQEKNPALYLKLVTEEFHEFLDEAFLNVEREDGFSDKKIAKEVGDLIWVSVLMLHVCGHDPREIMNRIADSNFSKFARTKEEAEESLDWYFKNKKEKGDYTYRDGYYVIQREDGKILKNKSTYHEPNWTEST